MGFTKEETSSVIVLAPDTWCHHGRGDRQGHRLGVISHCQRFRYASSTLHTQEGWGKQDLWGPNPCPGLHPDRWAKACPRWQVYQGSLLQERWDPCAHSVEQKEDLQLRQGICSQKLNEMAVSERTKKDLRICLFYQWVFWSALFW